MNVSIIIPLLNESESINELNDWIFKAFVNTDLKFEVIYIDDGSNDSSWNIIKGIAKSNLNIKGISFNRNYGKSQALRVGFSEAKGEYVATLEADLQDSPEEIPIMINKLIESNLDMISGWKKKRYDSFFLKRLPSLLFNLVARIFSGIRSNTSFKGSPDQKTLPKLLNRLLAILMLIHLLIAIVQDQMDIKIKIKITSFTGRVASFKSAHIENSSIILPLLWLFGHYFKMIIF